MAYIRAEIKLPEIFKTIPVQLFFPTDLPEDVGNRVRGVLTLLHGMSNTGHDWLAMSAAARYAADNGYILIMPDADNSFYTNMNSGVPFLEILSTMLPHRLNEIFKIPKEREQNHIAGLSMGGYGALRIGMQFPHKYANVGSFSGCVDMGFMLEKVRGLREASVLQPAFGPHLRLGEENNLFRLAENVARLQPKEKPQFLCTCGKQDEEYLILEQNRRFQEHVQKLAFPCEFKYWEGLHEWNVWDRSLTYFISQIESNDYAAKKQNDWCTPTGVMPD